MKGFPYVQEFTDNRGRVRRYFRRGTVRKTLEGEPGSLAFQTAYAAALSGYEAKGPIAKKRAKDGTIAALVASYYASREFLSLRASTQKTYRSVIEPFLEKHGAKTVKNLNRKWIEKEMTRRINTPQQANKWLKRIRQLLDHAIALDWTDKNPARHVKLYKPGKGFSEWPEELIEQYQKYWPIGTKQRLAFDLLLYTGQRRSDVVSMSKSHVRNGAIRVVQQKTGEPLWIPIHQKLLNSIAETPAKGLHFLETEYDKPFTSNGFWGWFRKCCSKADIPLGYSAHGLRKASGRRLSEAGCTDEEIMAVLGHRSNEVRKYTRGASQKRNAQSAMDKVK